MPGFGPDPEEAVDQLTDALSSGDVNGVDFATDDAGARTSYKAITDGMGKAKVSAGEVSSEGDSATGQLRWSWKVGSQTWSYKTKVQLTKGETDGGRRRLAGPLGPRPGAVVAPARRATRRDRYQARA